jgi:hypothetical protein
MTLVLMAIGFIATAAGLVTIGFGIPINAFSLGNTLIIAGTVGLCSGLILMGLSSVLGQLKRLNVALKDGVATRPVHANESLDTVSVRRAAPAAAEAPAIDHAPEPRFPATANETSAPAEAGPLDWLRAKASKPIIAPVPSAPIPPAMAEPPMMDVTDEAPLSPRAPRPAMPSPEPMQEPKLWSPGREEQFEPRSAPRAEMPMPRATPQPAESPKDKARFDMAWPDRAAPRASTEPRVETQGFDAKAFEAKLFEPKVEAKREPAFDMPMPPVPARPREPRSSDKSRMPEILRKAPDRGPAILKSGVIDGMPYTLYADGSIEAQLPQGMVKFASVDALRAHLEKQS